MIKGIVAAASLVLAGCASPDRAQREPYPVPHNAVLSEIVANPAAWHGRFLGFRGTVAEIERGPKGKPHIRLHAASPSGESFSLWVGSLIKPPDGWLAVGHSIRVVGWFSRIPSGELGSESSTRLIGGHHLLAQCIANETTSQALMLPAGREQCERWLHGEDPESLSRRKSDA